MWKILKAQIREENYYSLISRGLFSKEQKGCFKGTRDTRELTYIDQNILNESKTRRKNLSIGWIDNKKAYTVVLQSWILHCLKMYKISDKVIKFIEKTKEAQSVELAVEGKSVKEVKTQRGIFQGNASLPLLFVIAMVPLNHILRKCTTGYKLSKSQDQPLDVHARHQIVCQLRKRIGNPNTDNENI